MHSAMSPQHPATVAAVVASCRSDAWRFGVEAAPGSRSKGVGRRGRGRGWPQCVAPRNFGCTWPSPWLRRWTLQRTAAASMRRAASQQRPVIVDAAVASAAAEAAGRRLQYASPLKMTQMRQAPGSNAWHGVAARAFCLRRHRLRRAIAGRPLQRYEVHRGPATAGARTTRSARHECFGFAVSVAGMVSGLEIRAICASYAVERRPPTDSAGRTATVGAHAGATVSAHHRAATSDHRTACSC